MSKINFKRPDQEALKHTILVQEHLKSEVNNHQGWLSFHDFMNFVLYKPTLGYYSAGTHKIGSGGDFTTAPEISNLFGVAIANQLLPALRRYKKPSILEIGAGKGVYANLLNNLLIDNLSVYTGVDINYKKEWDSFDKSKFVFYKDTSDNILNYINLLLC